MAETIISPGSFTNETDSTYTTKGPIVVGAALVGPTPKGPSLVPTKITSYPEFTDTFGTTFVSGSNYYSYLTNYTAKEYFDNGGKTLLVTRVNSITGSFAYASASLPTSGSTSGSITSSITIAAISPGTAMNNVNSSYAYEVSDWNPATYAGTGSLDTKTALPSGSANNVRWEVSYTGNVSGTFGLNIRRGDDNSKQKVYLEQWSNLSLDPISPNYISKIIGDQYQVYDVASSRVITKGSYPSKSKYIVIKSVDKPTLNYTLDPTTNAAFLPAVGTGFSAGSFAGGADIALMNPQMMNEAIVSVGTAVSGSTPGANSQGFVAADYLPALSLLANKEEFAFNLLFLPGMLASNTNLAPAVSSAASICEAREDCFLVTDAAGFGDSPTTAVSNMSGYNTSYAAAYYPFVQIRDNELAKNVWVPASTVLAGAFAFNDANAAEWFAPAGLNRGGLSTVIQSERKLSRADRDVLYAGNINPLATFPGDGVVVYGQKTLQRKASATDRINVRRLLIVVKSFISGFSRNLVFENNTTVTRKRFLNAVNPYLDNIVQKQGLYAFEVVMDESNNTSDVIDRDELRGQIKIQPTRAIEFIILDFNITPTGSTFSA